MSGDWYELHASVACNKENDVPNAVDDDIKAEEIDYSLDEMSLKSESNYFGTVDVQADEFEQTPVVSHNHIVANPLPVIGQCVVKKVTSKSNTRKPKFSPKIAIKREPIKREPMEVKQETTNVTAPKKRKKLSNKATFMDHRPKSTCICDICNKTLGTFSSLRNHILNMHCVSEKNERVSCNECGQTFSTPGNLNSHKKIHLKCKAYVCTYCGRGFNQLHNLKEHTNRHTGEKPYLCTWNMGDSVCGNEEIIVSLIQSHFNIK